MTPELNKFVKCYNRGVITPVELAIYIVERTAEHPTEKFVASLPIEVMDHIREWAGAKPGTPGRCITSTSLLLNPDAWAAFQQEHAQRWHYGISFWRDYFGYTTEQNK
jgi:hypothetical protein